MTDINDVIEETNAAIESVTNHANTTWKAVAYGVIKELAESGKEFTSFSVVVKLEDMDIHTSDLRALGGVMRKAAFDGIIEPTGEYLPNVYRHMAPCRVWRAKRS